MLKQSYFVDSAHGFSFSAEKFLLINNNIKFIDSHRLTVKNDLSKEDFLKILKDLNLSSLIGGYLCNKDKDFVIHATSYEISSTEIISSFSIVYTDTFDIKDFRTKYDSLLERVEIKKGFKFNLVTIVRGDAGTITKYSEKEIKIDKVNSYNPSVPLTTIIDDITSDKSGLIIFSSKPGAGKSSLIKYLAQELTEKKFFFLPNSSLHILSDPSFTNYCLNELHGSVLVLEDCEKALISRDINKGYDISNILNITDGIMGDLLNIKIIATLNTTDKLDTALLRKGRLIRHVEFNPLTKEQASNLSLTLGRTIPEAKEMMLCDVYNLADNGNTIINTTKIGF